MMLLRNVTFSFFFLLSACVQNRGTAALTYKPTKRAYDFVELLLRVVLGEPVGIHLGADRVIPQLEQLDIPVCHFKPLAAPNRISLEASRRTCPPKSPPNLPLVAS